MGINADTKLCILIGDPVRHSVSPDIHNAAFQALGLNFAYLAFAVKDPGDAVRGIRGLGIRGASVTFPHKQNVMPHLDELSPLAKKINAVNTIVNEDGKLIGHNTDGEAAYLSLCENGVRLDAKKIVILGAGGACRAIAFTLAAKPKTGEIVLFDMEDFKAASLAREVAAKTGTFVRSEKMREPVLARELENAAVLINTAPVGVYPDVDRSPVPQRLVGKGLVVFDIVYNPARTLLLKYARKAGNRTIPGLEMLVRQAGEQFRIWTGKKPPLEVMFKAGGKGLRSKPR